ncbi:hypothetical protein [Elizabethkingia anophelis]|uniref:hypothetical protein n=1 Tax=Elizabethkingia anophelis TaxID=1117645 RepID=UPI00389270B7
MTTLNDYDIKEYISTSFEYNNSNVKDNDLRANVSLTKITATALLGLTSISTQAHTFDFNIPKKPIEEIALVINKINQYAKCTDILINKSQFVDKDKIIETIISFRSLQNSWDGYNALPLGVKCATNAIRFINIIDNNSLNKLSDIFPNPHGTISFEWENESNEIIALEIGKDTFSYYVSLNNLDTQYYNKQNFSIEDITIVKEHISAI